MDNLTYAETIASGQLANGSFNPQDQYDPDSLQPEDMETNMDFMRFVQQLHFHLQHNLGAFPHITPPPLRPDSLFRPDRVIPWDVVDGLCDNQGINWKAMGVPERGARHFRTMMYRNFTHFPHLSRMIHRWDLPKVPRTGHYFNFRGFDTKSITFQPHFQLRHMLGCSSKSDVYWVTRKKVYNADPATGASCMVLDFSKPRVDCTFPGGWKTSTLCVSDGVILVGNFSGQYALATLDTAVEDGSTQGTITTADDGITTHIHTYLNRTGSHPMAVFASNDSKVRTLDCNTNTFLSTHSYPYAINCAATSPDGRLRVLVGDSTHVTISDADTGEHLHRLTGHKDHGFACAWSDNGHHVATSNQDMQIRIYDARNWTRPFRIFTTDVSCARSLRFSPTGSGEPVLVAAEASDLVHVFEATTFAKQQRLEQYGELAGVEFNPDGSEFFVANSDRAFGGIMNYERPHNKGPPPRRYDSSGDVAERCIFDEDGVESSEYADSTDSDEWSDMKKGRLLRAGRDDDEAEEEGGNDNDGNGDDDPFCIEGGDDYGLQLLFDA